MLKSEVFFLVIMLNKWKVLFWDICLQVWNANNMAFFPVYQNFVIRSTGITHPCACWHWQPATQAAFFWARVEGFVSLNDWIIYRFFNQTWNDMNSQCGFQETTSQSTFFGDEGKPPHGSNECISFSCTFNSKVSYWTGRLYVGAGLQSREVFRF